MEKARLALDARLDALSYAHLNGSAYVPSEFALGFAAFVKLVNGAEGEQHRTPPLHLAMLDTLASGHERIANLCFRGAAKTTLFAEYLVFYLAVFGELPGFGAVSGIIYVSDSMDNGAKSAQRNMHWRWMKSAFLQYWLPDAQFTQGWVQLQNREGRRLGLRLFGAKTGLRGTRIFGKRPQLAILDDLVADDDARSRPAMELIKDTVYKGVNHALDPARRKIIFNGTPFNKDDVLVQAVESGAWAVNVWPVCGRFPCDEAEFEGAWPDRFGFAHVREQYEMAQATGRLDSFYQELMLRLSDAAGRLVQEADLRWFARAALLENRARLNFYMTTDFATSSRQTADFSVISVWAFDGDAWCLVDGVCARMAMDATMEALFRLAAEYRPQQVGIEVSGQQGGFAAWIAQQMQARRQFFNLAQVRPQTDKLSRFHLVVPLFKAGRIRFAEELKDAPLLREMVQEIRMATWDGLKGKDDCLDTISMLAHLRAFSPSIAAPDGAPAGSPIWGHAPSAADPSSLGSYIA